MPLWITQNVLASGGPPPHFLMRLVLTLLVVIQGLGFGVGALADFTKTWVKQRQGNESFLVTSGIFAYWRHPNYSGEILGWTANAMIGLLTALWFAASSMTAQTIPWSAVLLRWIPSLGLMGLGWMGIVFVLLRATSNLETRQAKDYHTNPKY